MTLNVKFYFEYTSKHRTMKNEEQRSVTKDEEHCEPLAFLPKSPMGDSERRLWINPMRLWVKSAHQKAKADMPNDIGPGQTRS